MRVSVFICHNQHYMPVMLFSIFRPAIVVLMMMKLSLNARPAFSQIRMLRWHLALGIGIGIGIGFGVVGVGSSKLSSCKSEGRRGPWHLPCRSANACTLVMKSNLRYIRLIVRILFVDLIRARLRFSRSGSTPIWRSKE